MPLQWLAARPDEKKKGSGLQFWFTCEFSLVNPVSSRPKTRTSGWLETLKLPHDASVCECCVSALQWTSDMFRWTCSVCQVTDRLPFDPNLSKWQLTENGWEHSFTHDSTHSMLTCTCGLISAHRTWIKLRSLDRFDGKCIWQTMEVGHNYCFPFLTDD